MRPINTNDDDKKHTQRRTQNVGKGEKVTINTVLWKLSLGLAGKADAQVIKKIFGKCHRVFFWS